MEILRTIVLWCWPELLAVVGGILAVYVLKKKDYPNRPIPLSDNELPKDFSELIHKHEDDLAEIGFHPYATFYISLSVEAKGTARLYASDQVPHRAMLCLAEATNSIVRAVVLEFSTLLTPHGEICTNTADSPNSVYYPHDLTVTKLPRISYMPELLYRHQEFCDEAEKAGFRPFRKKDPSQWERDLQRGFERDYEIQVKRWRMRKCADGGYRLTLWGATLAVPLIALQMLHSWLFSLYRPSPESLLRRIRRRYFKATLMSEQFKTYHPD